MLYKYYKYTFTKELRMSQFMPTMPTKIMTNPCLYNMRLLPMVPVTSIPSESNDVSCDEYGTPYFRCDRRALVNFYKANTIFTHYNFDKFGNTQLEVPYSYADLEDDLDGLDIAIHSKYYNHIKELQSHKDLLDHVTFLEKLGDMKADEITSTQNTIHNKMKDGHNPFYKWIDISFFPKDLMDQLNYDFINYNIVSYLRKKYKVWYVSFQETRFVIMGDNEHELLECFYELKSELQTIAGGEWIDEEYGTTQRYERTKTRVDLELSNIDLIADTWNKTYEETERIIYDDAEDELRKEQGICMFALTGDYIIVPENTPTYKNSDDNTLNLIEFNNGVYDIVNEEFRDKRPEDPISWNTNIDYVPYEPNLTEDDTQMTQMISDSLEKLIKKGLVSKELKEGGDPENPEDWLYYMDARQREHIRDARLSPTQSS